MPSSAWSQAAELRIKLNTVDGSPVNGALIALLDSRDSVVAEGLGSENGSRVLRAPPGEYRVGVRRIRVQMPLTEFIEDERRRPFGFRAVVCALPPSHPANGDRELPAAP